MFHSDFVLKEGAFVVSDAHYSYLRPQLLNFLQDIESNKLQPTQLILMGDIFDALFGGIKKSIERNSEAISIINTLSQRMEVLYLEGNHDFNLKRIFPHVKVFPLSKQPVSCMCKDEKVILSHGDFDGVLAYKVYSSIVRNRFVLKFLNLFDTYLFSKLDVYLSQKDDCKELHWFEGFIRKRIANNYDAHHFIEGHFHQNKIIKLDTINYINLAAFACNQRYFIVNSSKDKKFLCEKTFSKET
ncbi:metallophosphoesterase [Sulfurimonas sp. SAG-AH-194-I05]|nr:metallophosphoesterase [Sulfurimonas sp. SAG-AH-194-I05]MDF1875521.1 metallophosphoesterase [Sulfurimonas sp. SAG-AH-194-I05]